MIRGASRAIGSSRGRVVDMVPTRMIECQAIDKVHVKVEASEFGYELE